MPTRTEQQKQLAKATTQGIEVTGVAADDPSFPPNFAKRVGEAMGKVLGLIFDLRDELDPGENASVTRTGIKRELRWDGTWGNATPGGEPDIGTRPGVQ
jgi:hypothetical protein